MALDLDAIATDLAAILGDIGYNAYAIVPASVPQYPAAVVSVPTEVDYATSLGLACVTFVVTVAFSAADAKDCQTRLKKALGTTDATSIFVALNALGSGDNWRQTQVTKAEDPRYVQDGNKALVLAADIAVDVYASKT